MVEHPRQARPSPEAVTTAAALALRQEPHQVLRQEDPRQLEGGRGPSWTQHALLPDRVREGLRGGALLHGRVAGFAAQRRGEFSFFLGGDCRMSWSRGVGGHSSRLRVIYFVAD